MALAKFRRDAYNQPYLDRNQPAFHPARMSAYLEKHILPKFELELSTIHTAEELLSFVDKRLARLDGKLFAVGSLKNVASALFAHKEIKRPDEFFEYFQSRSKGETSVGTKLDLKKEQATRTMVKSAFSTLHQIFHKQTELSLVPLLDSVLRSMPETLPLPMVAGVSELALLQTCIAIVLVTLTNLRTTEILQLTFLDLTRIKSGHKLHIKAKCRRSSFRQLVSKPLFQQYEPLVRLASVCSHSKVPARRRQMKLVVSDVHLHKWYSTSRLLVVSKSTLCSTLKTWLASILGVQSTASFGIQFLRKFNTTQLLKVLDKEEVRKFNRHCLARVTVDFYKLKDEQAVEQLWKTV